MPFYRKKPVVIEAAQWFRNGDHPEVGCYRMPPLNEAGEVDVNGELNGQKRHCDLPYNSRPTECQAIMHDHGWVDTLEGGHIVCPGDWIIRGVQGEHYPCKPDIFEETYEPLHSIEEETAS